MIKVIPSQLGITPSVYGVEIDENICQGYYTGNTPVASVSVENAGSVIDAGDTIMQKLAFTITISYQPCKNSTEMKVKSFIENAYVVAPIATGTITPTIATTNSVIITKTCCNDRAHGTKVLTSVSVAFA